MAIDICGKVGAVHGSFRYLSGRSVPAHTLTLLHDSCPLNSPLLPSHRSPPRPLSLLSLELAQGATESLRMGGSGSYRVGGASLSWRTVRFGLIAEHCLGAQHMWHRADGHKGAEERPPDSLQPVE